ncbi:hypothetical protein [Paenibacillus sp. ATY16]|uniref:hypothetical protein n=1 Tax=Paenibacillus sp. ATY16 TaxID=1759312 RepID=UPI00200C0271|nr:hypothetical protein [Paenibacillus sp. ATY16]MCK9860922.1 hypothetical protein [Paenibacillus sp. ATY16]
MFEVGALREWMLANDLESKLYSAFWRSFEHYKVEESAEFGGVFPNYDSTYLELKIDSVSIKFSNNYPDFDYNHVVATLNMEYSDHVVGYYKLFINFDGTVDDDMFVIY